MNRCILRSRRRTFGGLGQALSPRRRSADRYHTIVGLIPPLFQPIGDLVEAGAGAGFALLAARRAADAEAGDGLLAGPDQDPALPQKQVRNLVEKDL